MAPLKMTIIFSIIAAIYLTVCCLDHKKGWHIADWINGRCSNPFTQTQKATKSLDDKEMLTQQLIERVQILEKIVTEPSYELNKKLNQL